MAGWESVGVGIVIMVAAAFVASLSHTHFPDVLSLKVGVSLLFAAILCQWAINWLSISLTMYLGGLFFSPSHIRLVDVVGTQGMARFPYFVGTFFGFSSAMAQLAQMLMYQQYKIGEPVTMALPQMVWAIVQIIAMLGLMVWMIVLMYQAFAVSVNLKGGKGVAVFIGGLVVGVLLSMGAMRLMWPYLKMM